ncbi:alpha/beta fold hydrolase [Streptomyces sp. SL13]|uniref:Alpha/beta fold hydrolase n=1 Tax=Streptantibioticus silvisoli TaxID=2705255 RepID=A0AA90H5M8_9ACTN|nr:alpha/beta fold hydrolase [Streptantibioticus silvisoli]MDI5969260.1 alpha/beta fold hydrolase [Streptantibioticus silvisoli]
MTTSAPQDQQPPGVTPFEEWAVPVDGGELSVPRWPATVPDAPVVVALHGITANGLAWARVAHHLAGRATLLAPDLRGRGRSGTLPGPYGVDAHLADLRAVLAAAGADRVTLTGHSMGAFLAAVAAARTPRAFSSVLLVDGGVGFPRPAGLSPDDLITAVIGPAMKRLSMTFSSVGAYLDFWRRHPAFEDSWSPWVEAYIRRDLAGREPELRSACSIDAVRVDGVGQFDDEVLGAVHRLTGPARLLWAERGVMNEPQGLYDPARLAAAGLSDTGTLTTEPVPATNHYTVLTSDEGARVIADRLLAAA